MKIVFSNDLIYAYATGASSAVGGAERQQWLLARSLATSGWQVVVASRETLQPRQRISIDSVEFVGIGPGQIFRAWYRFLAVEQPDWWYWRCASHLLGPAVAISKALGVRTIFATAFDRDVEIRNALYRRPRWWPLYGLGLLWTDRIFVQSEQQLVRLPQRLRRKATVVPSMATEAESSKPHSIRPKYVAWVAMFRQCKRPDLLIEIARRAPDICFVVCGGPTDYMASPGYGDEIADKLRVLPNVTYHGQIPPDEALQVIMDAAVFLSTADEEGFPNTFLQAWSAGTPVVSVTVDPDGIIKHYGLGEITPTVEDTLSVLRNLLSTSEQRQAISRRAQTYVAMNHGASAVIKLIETATSGGLSPLPLQRDSATPV